MKEDLVIDAPLEAFDDDEDEIIMDEEDEEIDMDAEEEVVAEGKERSCGSGNGASSTVEKVPATAEPSVVSDYVTVVSKPVRTGEYIHCSSGQAYCIAMCCRCHIDMTD